MKNETIEDKRLDFYMDVDGWLDDLASNTDLTVEKERIDALKSILKSVDVAIVDSVIRTQEIIKNKGGEK